jgi:ribonuclease BN (tRNA processing enzyme)
LRHLLTGAATLALALALGAVAEAAESGGNKAAAVQLITLGTGGGPLTRLKRSEPANALVVGGVVYLIDAGDRVLQQLEAAGIGLRQVRTIFVTHYHQDHVSGLMPLLGIRWMLSVPGPLQLVGPAGLQQVINGFRTAMQPSVDAGFGSSVTDPVSPLKVTEIAADGLVYSDENIKVFAVTNTHYNAPVPDASRTPKSYSYRFETQQGVVVFTGDTGPSEAVTRLARGADLLVSEVINIDGAIAAVDRLSHGTLPPNVRTDLVRHMTQDHIQPEQVGEMAGQAEVKRVVLSHLSPGLDSESAADVDALYAAGVRKRFKGSVTVASDLQSFVLSSGD